jgi:RNA polymerase sigma-70 factor (ECF subfamily)
MMQTVVELQDDLELVRALKAGDRDAPRRLVEQYQSILFSMCMRMLGHRQDAEDVLQDTFVRALRGIGGFDGARPLRPWLLGIAANRCRTALARRGRRPVASDLLEYQADLRAAVADPDDLGGELERAIASLRPNYRMVFVMYHEQGLPYEEIGQVMGCPLGTIKTWIHRARAQLAEILGRRGLDEG